MVMLRELGALVARAHGNITRLPVPTGFGFGFGGTSQIGRPGQQVAMMETYGKVGTLFSVISRITEGVATPDWHLYRKGATAEERIQMPDDHPMMMLWNDINPFTDRFNFLEASQQHFELVGEMWWVILRAGNGLPAELQLIRPDRMFPIPDKEHFIRGYVYRAGSEMVNLEIEDVILIKRPSPLDPYRGIGVIQSILVDLGAEEQAALYNRNFFLNDATPGGIIQLDKSVSDAEFEKLRRHWNDQHRGVANAHRVAIIERAEWKSSHITQREMQFKDLRGISQEIIMTAFGIPRALLGISENVNRANAEVAELTFARWLVVPRLRRIKRAVNKYLVEPVYGMGFELDFDDPTPDDNEFNRVTAFEGFTNKLLTKNEARGIIGYAEVEGGDEFEVAPEPQPFGGFGMGPGAGNPGDKPEPPELEDPDEKASALNPATRNVNPELIEFLAFVKEQMGLGLSTASRSKGARLDLAEFHIMRGWVRRLDEQKAELLTFLGQFDDTVLAAVPGISIELDVRRRHIIAKLEAGDLDGFNWDWWTRYGDEVTAELHEAFAASLAESFPALDIFAVERLAAEYASFRGAQLLRLDGPFNIAEATRARVNSLVAGTLERGDSLGQLQKALREDVCFSPSRARTVARTETATAQGQGGMEAAKAQAMTEKMWVTQGDSHVDIEHCLNNEKQGWIKISDPFQSGHDMIPAHPNCLIGSSRVLAQGITGVSKRWYEGEVVTIRTASGNQLTCTPNHPILSSGTWKPARQLEEGDDVISRRISQGVGFSDVNNDNVPATIEQIVDTFLQSGKGTTRPVPIAAKDFHGDGTDGQVAVIWADSVLGNRFNQPSPEQFPQHRLNGGDAQKAGLAGDSAGIQLGISDYPAYGSAMGSNVLGSPLFFGHAAPLDEFLGSGSSKIGVSFDKAPVDGSTGYLVPTREQIDRVAGDVFVDEIIEIRREPFSGHVYNLETEDGFYVAESIISHNCRCTTLYRGGDPEVDPFEGLDDDIGEAIEGSRLEEGMRLSVGETVYRYMEVDNSLTNDIERRYIEAGGRAIAAGELGLCQRCHRTTTIKNRDGEGWWCRKCQKVVE